MKAILKPYLQPAFLICALVLLTAATSKSLVIQALGWQLTKHPLPLQNALHEMDESAMEPFVVVNKTRIDNPDVLAALGTEDYLQWLLEDPQAEDGSPTQFAMVFVTYYTGDPDIVPHVPDECYVGGGNVRKGGFVDTARLNRGGQGDQQTLNYQNILFGRTNDPMHAGGSDFYVAYLFHANGQYSGSRTETRRILGQNFLSRYSYFSKVEWQFFGQMATPFGRQRIYPDRQETVEASERLLNILLPVLENDHWPDWEAANREDTSS